LAEFSGSGWQGGGCLLPEEKVREAMEAEGVSCRQCLFTPLVTLWTFLSQVMSPDHSCRAAVARLMAWVAAQGPQAAQCAPCDEEREIDTGAYCKARERLPEKLISRLAKQAGSDLHARFPAGLLLALAVSSVEREGGR
jgi:hypothetical protein